MPNGEPRIVDSQSSFSGGVDTSKTPMRATPYNPDGLTPSQIAWLINATCRGGGIQPRSGYARRVAMPAMAAFQGSFTYEPLSGSPYEICSIGGVIYKVDLESYEITNLSAQFNLYNPTDTAKAFFCQGEEFLVIQAGDYITLPLFWDGVSLTRSRGMVQSSTGPLPGPSFTVPAIGQPVLVDLGMPYTGMANEIFMIGGYRYQQVSPNQRYSYSSTISLPSPSYSSGTVVRLDYAATYSISPMSGIVPAVLLRAISTSFSTLGAPPITAGPGLTSYLQSTAITPADTFRLTDQPSTNLSGGAPITWGQVDFTFTPNPLAAPGANQVWMINLDDPRAGTVVTTPAPYPTQAYNTQLPAGGPMDYYGDRFWIANGREYMAGDIVGGPSGSGPYELRDSILYVTENDFLSGGGTFAVPTNAGNITALKHNANLDTSLGEGLLFVFTRQTIYSVNVPPERATWAALTEPIQRVVQINYGTTSDRSVVAVNGDLFFRSLNGIQSLISAIRYFGQWANPPLSNEEERALLADDTTMLGCATGIVFNNRVLQSCLPVQTAVGLAYQGLMPLDFQPIASARQQLPPVWEGLREGLDILQLVKGDFDGQERAFAFVHARYSGQIELWEITADAKEDANATGDARITWILETPSYTFRNPNQLKQLEMARIWIDRLYGRADFTLYYRNDQNACWTFWNAWSQCAARNNCEDPGAEYSCYPTQTYKQQYRAMMAMPRPPVVCDEQMDRPTDIAYSFQLRLVVKGFCRLRGLFLYALERQEQAFEGLVCIGDNVCGSCTEGPEGPPGRDGMRGSGFTTYLGTFADPNGIQTGQQGDVYKNTDTGELFVKASLGVGNTGWQ